MKNQVLKSMALLVVSAMCLAACGQNGSDEPVKESKKVDTKTEETQKDDEEVVTLSMFSSFNNGGSEVPWFQNYLEENLGINLEAKVNTGNADVMSALLASGELPDIVGFSDTTQLVNAIEGGLVLNLDEYKEQLPNIFEDDFFDTALQYKRDKFGAETGGLYALPLSVGSNRSAFMNIDIRWDIYKKIGYPEANNWEELLEILKQMQDAVPTTEDGQPIYAYSLWDSWDSNYMNVIYSNYSKAMGYLHGVSDLTEVPIDGSLAPKSILDDDSIYKAGLQYFFDANQMGLIDPDSATQSWDAVNGKMNNGQTILTPFSWWRSFGNSDTEDFKGYHAFAPAFFKASVGAYQATGTSQCLAVSSDCKNLDKALEFLNWFYSLEAHDVIHSGPEGVFWKYEGSQKVATEAYYDGALGEVQMEGGGTVGEAYAIINGTPRTSSTLNEETGQWLNFLDELDADKDNYLTRDWKKQEGDYIDFVDQQEAEGDVLEKAYIFNIVSPAPDEIKQIENQIGEIVITNSWKMVFAENQEEFDALWEQTKSDALGLGLEKVLEDAQERWKTANEEAEKYSK